VGPVRLAGLLSVLAEGTINQTAAKEVFAALVEDPSTDAAAVVAERGLATVVDEGALGELADAVIAAHPEEAQAFRDGRGQVIGFLVGQGMKQSGGRADAKALQALLRERLTS
jgi:aspartyl-tRNA(Asn)/glutamyl-tRNA(Gln) amidotransferase subunit B